MSQNPFIPAKPVEITLDTLPQLFAHHRARFGGWSMTSTPPEPDPSGGGGGNDDPPERPEGVTEEDWNSLGDPGKRAIVRERNRADTAERALAASRARPAAPKAPQPSAPTGVKPADPPKPTGDQPDFAALIQQAVDAAVKPFNDREEQRGIDEAAGKVRTTVLDAAKLVLHDATDALAGIDLTTVIDDHGVADPAKVKTALDDLVVRKPHLAKPATQRTAPPGIGGGAPAPATDGEKVAATLARMQGSVNLRPPAPQQHTS